MNLPLYRSHKLVRGFKIGALEPESLGSSFEYNLVPEDITLGSGVLVSAAYVAKHNPKVGGYYVLYEDGYESWSPAEAFEGGYTLIEREDNT